MGHALQLATNPTFWLGFAIGVLFVTFLLVVVLLALARADEARQARMHSPPPPRLSREQAAAQARKGAPNPHWDTRTTQLDGFAQQREVSP